MLLVKHEVIGTAVLELWQFCSKCSKMKSSEEPGVRKLIIQFLNIWIT